jgi:hypothetical protein
MVGRCDVLPEENTAITTAKIASFSIAKAPLMLTKALQCIKK